MGNFDCWGGGDDDGGEGGVGCSVVFIRSIFAHSRKTHFSQYPGIFTKNIITQSHKISNTIRHVITIATLETPFTQKNYVQKIKNQLSLKLHTLHQLQFQFTQKKTAERTLQTRTHNRIVNKTLVKNQLNSLVFLVIQIGTM